PDRQNSLEKRDSTGMQENFAARRSLRNCKRLTARGAVASDVFQRESSWKGALPGFTPAPCTAHAGSHQPTTALLPAAALRGLKSLQTVRCHATSIKVPAYANCPPRPAHQSPDGACAPQPAAR